MARDFHQNLAGELMDRRPRRTRRAAYWIPGRGWTFEQACPARPANDLQALRIDLGWLATSYPALAIYDSLAGTYTPALVQVVTDAAGGHTRLQFPPELKPESKGQH